MLLLTDQVLPPAVRDHALTGDWIGYRDCHIKPDVVMIYADTLPTCLALVGKMNIHPAVT